MLSLSPSAPMRYVSPARPFVRMSQTAELWSGGYQGDWNALLQAAEAGDIDALPLKPELRTEELSLLAETEGIVAQVAAVREDAALQSRAFALALEAAVSRLPEGQREALLGAKDFVTLPDGGLNAARRSLAALG